MTLVPHIETNNGSADLGKRLKASLESYGYRKVRVYDKDELLSVQGRIGERGKLTIRVDRKEKEKEIFLEDVYRHSKIIWNRIDDSDFPEIISIATHLISHTELRSNIVVETDTGTRGGGDAEKMNVLRMNATAYQPIPSSTENGAMAPTSTNSTIEAHCVPTTLTSEVTNEPIQSSSKPKGLGVQEIIAAILTATVVSGAFFYLLSEIRTSHEHIENLKQQLKD